MASESFTLSEKAYQYSIQHKTLYHTLSFNKPLANINLDSIYIKLDSATTTSIKPSNLSIDSLYHTIILSAKIDKPADTLSDGKLNKFKPYLQYGKGAFISVEQDSSKKISKTISFPQEDDTGLVTGKISTQEKNFEIQLTTFDNKIVEKLINAKEINLQYLTPQDYRVRIIIDSNGNGKWDPGNFYKKIEPEKVVLYKSDEGKYTFPIRANWEYGPLLIKF